MRHIVLGICPFFRHSRSTDWWKNISCSPAKPSCEINDTYYWFVRQLVVFSKIIDFLQVYYCPSFRASHGQRPSNPEVQGLTTAGRPCRNLLKPPEWSNSDWWAFWKLIRHLCKDGETGAKASVIIWWRARDSLSERFPFLSSFILPDHMADLYITKELPGRVPASL